ncbi:MAG: hypothetical protein WC554_01885 [Clostridia bacterium]
MIERYYTRFCEKGYIVRDSENNHKIVYRGKHPNGNDAKKWALEQNNKLLKPML